MLRRFIFSSSLCLLFWLRIEADFHHTIVFGFHSFAKSFKQSGPARLTRSRQSIKWSEGSRASSRRLSRTTLDELSLHSQQHRSSGRKGPRCSPMSCVTRYVRAAGAAHVSHHLTRIFLLIPQMQNNLSKHGRDPESFKPVSDVKAMVSRLIAERRSGNKQ